jgi:arylsulfatase A
MPLNRISLLVFCSIASIVAGHAAHHEKAPQALRPHIVFILADDMGYGDLKAYNPQSKIPTPHLNHLASEGLIFTDAHSGGSTCKPSRYALFTGRFSARKQRLNDKEGPILDAGRATIASLLRDNGYQTAMVGKWHLGFDQKGLETGKEIDGFAFDFDQPLTGGPVDRGFESLFGTHASLDIPPYFYIENRTPTMAPTETIGDRTSVGGPEDWTRIQGEFWRGGAVAPDFKHIEVTPRFANEASKVIESRDTSRPLFLYLALPSPHTPWLPTEEFVGKSGAGMYGDFVMQVDAVVGQVMASLEKAGISNNTLVFFTSDNGPVWYDKDAERFGHQSTGPLLGAKGSAWEGGHRMPFIARWPDKIEASSRSDHTISFVDVFATFAGLAGQESIAEGAAEDSVSFLPVMLDHDGNHESRRPILHSDKVIRDGDWKLIDTKRSRGFTSDRSKDYGIELFNLAEDLSETNNLIDRMPEKAEYLRMKIKQILGE